MFWILHKSIDILFWGKKSNLGYVPACIRYLPCTFNAYEHMRQPCIICHTGGPFQPPDVCMYIYRKHHSSIVTTLFPSFHTWRRHSVPSYFLGSDNRFQAGAFCSHRAHARRVIQVFGMARKVYGMDTVVCRQADI